MISEKARTSQQIASGVTAILPIGAVAHLIKGDEKETLEIATGEYDKKLDEKISEIKKACDL